MSLAAALAEAEPLRDGFRATIPPDWHQGRTSYGGFSSALALSAALRIGGELPPLRSAQVSMIGPVAGQIEVRARELRRGRNAVWIGAEITGEGGLGLAATFVFMRAVESVLQLDDRPAPAGLIAPGDALPLSSDRGSIFLQHHFDVRFALPRAAQKRAEMCWWVRPREREGLTPGTELVLVADALPPGVMPLVDPSVPASTMQWQLNVLTPQPATDDWWLLRSTGDYAAQGCSSQRMAVWNASGEPVAAGMQSVALFG